MAPDQDQVIQDGIGVMGSILPRLSKGMSVDIDTALSEFEQCITRVSNAVNSLQLQ
jgi:predicted nucleotidyltransferase